MLITYECECGERQYLLGQPRPGMTGKEMLELGRKKHSFICDKCKEEKEMLKFVNKKGQKVLEMKDNGDLTMVAESLKKQGLEETVEEPKGPETETHEE